MRLTRYKNPWNEHTLEVIELSPLFKDLKAFSLASDRPTSPYQPSIYLTGGIQCGSPQESKAAYEFDIEDGKWHEDRLPELRDKRSCHASCTADAQLIVSGGFNFESGALDTYEILDLNNRNERWQGVTYAQCMQPRWWPMFCAFNYAQIVVSGGQDSQGQLLSDARLLDIEESDITDSVDMQYGFKFTCKEGLAKIVGKDLALSLVCDDKDVLHLVSFFNGNGQYKTEDCFEIRETLGPVDI